MLVPDDKVESEIQKLKELPLAKVEGFIRSTSFYAVQAWQAKTGRTTLFGRYGGRPYNPETEGDLDEHMQKLAMLHLACIRPKAA